MHALWFFLLLVFQGLLFAWVYPWLVMPLVGLLMLATRKNPEKARALIWFVGAIGFLGTAYVLWGWAAYIAHLSHTFSSTPEVTHHWLYFVLGFFGCVAPLASMSAGEDNIGSVIHFYLTAIVFIVFCVWPAAATLLYGWLPTLFGQ
jgi:hypothetical protein